MGEPAPRLTYAEYLALEANSEVRLEFVDGFVHAMAGGTPEHARLAMAMGAELPSQGVSIAVDAIYADPRSVRR